MWVLPWVLCGILVSVRNRLILHLPWSGPLLQHHHCWSATKHEIWRPGWFLMSRPTVNYWSSVWHYHWINNIYFLSLTVTFLDSHRNNFIVHSKWRNCKFYFPERNKKNLHKRYMTETFIHSIKRIKKKSIAYVLNTCVTLTKRYLDQYFIFQVHYSFKQF